MRWPALVFVGIFSVSLLINCLIVLSLKSVPLENLLGLMSIACYALTLLPSIIRLLNPQLKSNQGIVWLLKNRRYTGVAAFCFGADHGLIIMIDNQMNFLKWQDYSQYYQGFLILGILSVLAATSNDRSVKYLKQNWKKIHQVTYLIPLLLLWHLITKMTIWTPITPIAIGITSILIVGLFLKLMPRWLHNIQAKLLIGKG